MKKHIFLIAAAAIALCMASCQKEDNIDSNITARVRSTSDLHNTDWNYSITYSEFLNQMLGFDPGSIEEFVDDTMSFGLNFDGVYAHFSFPENVTALSVEDGEMVQIYGVSYTYSYDATTHTGYLNGQAENDNGEVVPAQLQFSYDEATDVITFVIPLVYAEDNNTADLTLNFHRVE